MAGKAAAPGDPPGRPRSWSKAVSAAYLRLMGFTQRQAARSAGVGERTLRGWESSGWWPEAVAEARGRWLQGLDSLARSTLARSLAEGREPPDGKLALEVLSRGLEPMLAPPEFHIYCESRIGWFETDDALPRHARGKGA